ncbi:hypothetical protein [Aquisphaera insulae]|uniref:hypothetical protein n=1 Tax=Aquisphaera insulae TaxID=2712864 RepID=UPI0013EC8B21|nr:hypothetical protein [Aquisphaera insulae]
MPRQRPSSTRLRIALLAMAAMAWAGTTAGACSMDTEAGCCCAAETAAGPGCCSRPEPGRAVDGTSIERTSFDAAPCNPLACSRNSTAPGDLPRRTLGSFEGTPIDISGQLPPLAVPSPPRAVIDTDDDGGSPPDIPIYLRTLHLIF